MSQKPQFVRAEGRCFMVGNQEFKFVGFNIRGLAHYGDANVLPASTVAQQTEFLAEAQTVGSAVVRLFLPHWSVRSNEELVNRLGIVLEKAATYRQRVIVCLIDHLETSKFQHWSISLDDGSPMEGYIYPDKHGHNVLSPNFYKYLYKEGPFLDYVTKLVTTFKDHPAVFAWELTNEGSNHPNHDDFINYCNDVAARIRTNDPNHMITAGIISTPVIEFKNESGNDKPARLYENLDFLTIHDYDPISSEDRFLAQRLNKPLIVEEVGRINGRDGFFHENMEFWFNNGAVGYLGWGFMPSATNNQDGDIDFGIDRALHSDYDEVTQVWRDRAASLPPVPPLYRVDKIL